MPVLNALKCFKNPLAILNDTNSPKSIPANWLDLLGNQWSNYLSSTDTESRDLIDNLNRHAGPGASYKEKMALVAGLQRIYLCLNNQLERLLTESEKKMVLLMLSSDIDACTPGFHNRVNQSMFLLQIPCSIESLLLDIRTQLVDVFARQQSNNVHDYNKIFFLAHEPFAVRVPNLEDPYMHSDPSLTEESIIHLLKKIFERFYQPVQVIEKLEQGIHQLLTNNFAYCGKIASGYDGAVYLSITQILEKIFELESLDITKFFITDDEANILDINWMRIKLEIFYYLQKNDYVSFSQPEQVLFTNLFSNQSMEISTEFDTNLVFQNQEEFICFLSYATDWDLEYKRHLVFNYFYKLKAEQLIPLTFQLGVLSESSGQSDLWDIIQELNERMYLLRNLVQDGGVEDNFFLQNLQKNKNISATLKCLGLLNHEDYEQFIQYEEKTGANFLHLALGLGENFVRQIIEHIRNHTRKNIFYHLLRPTNDENRHALLIALQMKNNTHRPILEIIKCLANKEKERLITHRDSKGVSCITLAMQLGQSFFNELIEFVATQSENCFLELILLPTANGLNAFSYSFEHPFIDISCLLKIIDSLDSLQKLQLLQQNSISGDNVLMQCCLHDSKHLKVIFEMIEMLDSYDQIDILKQKNLAGNTALDCLIRGKSTQINYFLKNINARYPKLLEYFLLNSSNFYPGVLLNTIKNHADALPVFLKYLAYLQEDVQLKIFLNYRHEHKGVLFYTVNYAKQYLPLIFTNLISYNTDENSMLIADFLYDELDNLITEPSKGSELFKWFLYCYDTDNQDLIERFCVYLSDLPRVEFIGFSEYLAKVLIELVKEEHPSENIFEFLSHYMIQANATDDEYIEIIIEDLLSEFHNIKIDEQLCLVPYAKFLFNISHYFDEPAPTMLFNYIKNQHLAFQKAFLLDADAKGNTLLSSYLINPNQLFLSFIEWIQQLDFEVQYTVWTQRNLLGKNILQLCLEHSEHTFIKTILNTLLHILLALDKKITLQLLRPLDVYPESNVLIQAVINAPHKLALLLKAIKDFPAEHFLLESLFMHANSEGYNLLLMAINKDVRELALLIKLIEGFEKCVKFRILNQKILGFEFLNLPYKNIFHLTLKENSKQLPHIIKLVQTLDLDQQRQIISVSHLQQLVGVDEDALNLFKNYQLSVVEQSPFSFFSGKRPIEESSDFSQKNKR